MNILKEFDKRFGEKYIISICESSDADLGAIKEFITKALSSQRKELIEEIEKMDKVGAVKLKSGKIIKIGEFDLISKDKVINKLK